MTRFEKTLGSFAVAGLFAAAAPATAGAILSFTTTNYGTQTVDPFGSFDWAQAGSALTTGFNTGANVGELGSAFTTVFMAKAVSVDYSGGGNALTTANGLNQANGYEFTIFATLTEQASCSVFSGGQCGSALYYTTGGSYKIYYQETPNADLLTGAGIADGINVLSGLIDSGFAGTFTATTGGGIGSFNFKGNVNYTNSAYINPSLTSGTSVATLQFGNLTTGWTQPSSFSNGTDAGTVALPILDPVLGQNFLFQADANSAFNVPEPGSLALLGLGLLGMAGQIRGRKA